MTDAQIDRVLSHVDLIYGALVLIAFFLAAIAHYLKNLGRKF